MDAENYEIAAARMMVALAELGGSDVEEWISELANQPLGPASTPPPEGLEELLSRQAAAGR